MSNESVNSDEPPAQKLQKTEHLCEDAKQHRFPRTIQNLMSEAETSVEATLDECYNNVYERQKVHSLYSGAMEELRKANDQVLARVTHLRESRHLLGRLLFGTMGTNIIHGPHWLLTKFSDEWEKCLNRQGDELPGDALKPLVTTFHELCQALFLQTVQWNDAADSCTFKTGTVKGAADEGTAATSKALAVALSFAQRAVVGKTSVETPGDPSELAGQVPVRYDDVINNIFSSQSLLKSLKTALNQSGTMSSPFDAASSGFFDE